jgi:nucleoside 2-deoxyribosyltransferase
MGIHVVGGVYHEYCVHPQWNELYGSAGRAAVAIAEMGLPIHLHSYFSTKSESSFRGAYGLYSALTLHVSKTADAVRFKYVHDSAEPTISPRHLQQATPISLNEDKVVRFGMLEGDAVINAQMAVYDPQNPGAPIPFGKNGSKAKRLALVLNAAEAQALSGAAGKTPEECARFLSSSESAEVVVIKQGPLGAVVCDRGQVSSVPAFRTLSVWKIGSGDCFVAHFALAWMEQGLTAAEAAARASRATAYYCQHRALPSPEQLQEFRPAPLKPSAAYRRGVSRKVYLAGPFFDLSQIWVVDEALRNLRELGLEVFSPFHDIGLGSAEDVVRLDIDALEQADLVFAIAGGSDPGTIFEVGYARAKGKKVVIYSEREDTESMKMAEGTACIICREYTTALYTTLWEAAQL